MPYFVAAMPFPEWDSLPVAIIKNYPFEKRDYKPYTQARLCVCQGELNIQLISFEVTPSPKSCIYAAFDLFPEEKKGVIAVKLYSGGSCELTLSRSAFSPEFSDPPPVHLFTGENQQGIYWGGNILIPSSSVGILYGHGLLSEGDVFEGNIYKLSSDLISPHRGSFFFDDFSGFETGQMKFGEFKVI